MGKWIRTILIASLFATAASAQVVMQDRGEQLIDAFVGDIVTFSGEFEQVLLDADGEVLERTTGMLEISRPGKFRWTYDRPYYQLLVGDGEKLWVHDRDLNQVTVKTLGDALASTPAALLAGRNELEKNFDLSEGGSEDGLDWVDAKPKANEGGFEAVRIGFKDGLLRGMVLRDSFGQTTKLRFTSFERNPAIDPAQFRFTPPAGADVISDDAKK